MWVQGQMHSTAGCGQMYSTAGCGRMHSTAGCGRMYSTAAQDKIHLNNTPVFPFHQLLRKTHERTVTNCYQTLVMITIINYSSVCSDKKFKYIHKCSDLCTWSQGRGNWLKYTFKKGKKSHLTHIKPIMIILALITLNNYCSLIQVLPYMGNNTMI